MRKQKVVSILSNTLFGAGTLISIAAIILTVSLRASLPPDVCPIDNNRPLYFIAAAMLVGSLALSIYGDLLKKREN